MKGSLVQQFPHSLHWRWFAASVALSAFAAFVAWTGQTPPLYFLAALPIMWAWCRHWWQRYTAGLTYSLIALWPVAGSISGFFVDSPAFAAIAGWVAFALLWPIPFVIVAAGDAAAVFRVSRSLVALVLSVVPPFGILAWCHPALAAGWLMPGGGALALAGLLCLWAVATALPFRWSALLAGSLLLIGAIQAPRVERQIDGTQQDLVAAIGTRAPLPTTVMELATHIAHLATEVGRVPPEVRIVVTPETAIANWRPATESLVHSLLASKAASRTLILGATFTSESPAGGMDQYGGAVLMGPAGMTVHRGRQPLPLSLWRPWDPSRHHSASWGEPGVRIIDGVPVAIRICAEEMTIFWSALDAVWGTRPQVVVGLVNAWWVNSPTQLASQLSHARAGAALLGVPMVRSINEPVTQPWRQEPASPQR